MNNIEHSAKYVHLADLLTQRTLSVYKEFHEELNKRSTSPFHMLEWGEDLFNLAAQWRFYYVLADACTTLAESNPDGYTTMDELRQFARRHWSPRGRHSSSNNSSNNLAAHLDELVLEFVFDKSGWTHREWFGRAQQLDPLYREWWEAEAARYASEREAKAAAQALAEKRMNEARARVRSAIKKGTGAGPARADLLLGWPDLTKARGSIRDTVLLSWVEGAHAEKPKRVQLDEAT